MDCAPSLPLLFEAPLGHLFFFFPVAGCGSSASEQIINQESWALRSSQSQWEGPTAIAPTRVADTFFLNEMTWQMVLASKVLFQAAVDGVTMAQSKCLRDIYWRFLYQVPLILCINKRIGDAMDDIASESSGSEDIRYNKPEQPDRADQQWLNENSFHLHRTSQRHAGCPESTIIDLRSTTALAHQQEYVLKNTVHRHTSNMHAQILTCAVLMHS